MVLVHKGYVSGPLDLDPEDGTFSGTILGIKDVIHFEGTTAEEVLQSFRDSVDNYLALRAERGEPVEAGGALMKASLSVVDMLRQDGPEADFDSVPPPIGTWSRLEATSETGFDLGGGQLDRDSLYTRTVPFIAFLRKDDGSDYGVEFPDVPGCVSAGRTVEEARTMAAEALAGHIATHKRPAKNRINSTGC